MPPPSKRQPKRRKSRRHLVIGLAVGGAIALALAASRINFAGAQADKLAAQGAELLISDPGHAMTLLERAVAKDPHVASPYIDLAIIASRAHAVEPRLAWTQQAVIHLEAEAGHHDEAWTHALASAYAAEGLLYVSKLTEHGLNNGTRKAASEEAVKAYDHSLALVPDEQVRQLRNAVPHVKAAGTPARPGK